MNKRNVIGFMSVCLLASFLAAVPVVTADIYSWVDENGVRHYSDTPPGKTSKVAVHSEILHDAEADQVNREAHQEMVRQVEAQRRESEKSELEERLKKTEMKLEAAERKAAQALDEAREARHIAEEKQRLREVYVVPWIGPTGNRPQRPVPYDPYRRPAFPRQ